MQTQKEMLSAIEEALDTIRPYLNADGGNIELVEITNDLVVKVRLKGACSDCPMSLQTLKGGVEMVVKRAVPSISAVESVI